MRCVIVLVRLPTVLSNIPGILIIQLSECMCVAAASVSKYISAKVWDRKREQYF